MSEWVMKAGLLLAALLAVAGAASAGVDMERLTGPADQLAQDVLASIPPPEPAEGEGEATAGPSPPPAPEDPAEGAEEESHRLQQMAQSVRDDATAQAEDAVAEAEGLVPEDPVGLLGDQVVRPAQEAVQGVAGDLPVALEPEDETPVAEPQSTGVEPVLDRTAFVVGSILVASAAAGTAVLVWLAGSSGTVGSAAAGGEGMRRLLPYASPLFTRFEKDTVLGHPKREQLYALIMQDPGVSLQALCDKTGLSRTAVTHHLRLLELQHLIVSKRMGRSRHYYENGGRYGRDQKEAYAVLHNERSRAVAQFIRDHPGAIQKSLCQALGLHPSIAHWHVRRLQEASLVQAVRQGRTVSYFPAQAMSGPSPIPEAPVSAAVPAGPGVGA